MEGRRTAYNRINIVIDSRECPTSIPFRIHGWPWNIIFVISKFPSRGTCPRHFLFHRFPQVGFNNFIILTGLSGNMPPPMQPPIAFVPLLSFKLSILEYLVGEMGVGWFLFPVNSHLSIRSFVSFHSCFERSSCFLLAEPWQNASPVLPLISSQPYYRLSMKLIWQSSRYSY